MRAQDEANLFAIHQQVNANRGAEPPEISLRMLMDKLNNPADITVKNSIIINLHGEMVPLVPLRNYSDAAKDPAYYWGGRGAGAVNRAWRVVTHPERLAYSNLTGTGVPTVAALRVYAYDMNPPADPITVADEDDIINNVTLFIPNGRLSNLQSVARIRGNSRYSYNWISQTATSWVMPNGTISDSVSPTTATWVADEYTPPGSRSMGLRIQLFGVTPTARPYGGSPN